MKNTINLLIFCLLFSSLTLVACRDVYTPTSLFTVAVGENAPLSLQQNRLYYGTILQPIVHNNRLTARKIPAETIKDIPAVYISYVSDYIKLVNSYLDKIPSEEAAIIIDQYRNWSVADAITCSYLRFENEQWSLGLSWDDASKIGIDSMHYMEYVEILRSTNRQLTDIPTNIHVVVFPESPVSIFMNHTLWGNLPISAEVSESFGRDFETLNSKYNI